eukprot:1570964-Alexandrium_andersonii.AAC.1
MASRAWLATTMEWSTHCRRPGRSSVSVVLGCRRLRAAWPGSMGAGWMARIVAPVCLWVGCLLYTSPSPRD